MCVGYVRANAQPLAAPFTWPGEIVCTSSPSTDASMCVQCTRPIEVGACTVREDEGSTQILNPGELMGLCAPDKCFGAITLWK